jgi:hypothetical protein
MVMMITVNRVVVRCRGEGRRGEWEKIQTEQQVRLIAKSVMSDTVGTTLASTGVTFVHVPGPEHWIEAFWRRPQL